MTSMRATLLAATVCQASATTAPTPLSVPVLASSPGIWYAKEIERMVAEYNVRVPVRSFMDDEEYQWRWSHPNYTLDNYYYLKGKTMNHSEGSLEVIVEDLVKTWEFERSHKVNLAQHKAIDQSTPCAFTIQANGNKRFCSAEAHEVGNYNVLLNGVDAKLWPENLTWVEADDRVKGTWDAFMWEVLQVFSPPPKVSFSWRHWAHFTGAYDGNKGGGELEELYGFATATVNSELKLQHVEVYYKPEKFLEALEGIRDAKENYYARSVMGSMCPQIAGLEDGAPCVFDQMRSDDVVV